MAVSFALSFAASRISWLGALSGGTKVIILTVVISASAALLFPVKEADEEKGGEAA